MFLTMERAYGGAGRPWRASAGFRVLPGGRGEAGGDTGASGPQALDLLFRKHVAQETSWSLPPPPCSATPDFPWPRAAVTAEGGREAPGKKPKSRVWLPDTGTGAGAAAGLGAGAVCTAGTALHARNTPRPSAR